MCGEIKLDFILSFLMEQNVVQLQKCTTQCGWLNCFHNIKVLNPTAAAVADRNVVLTLRSYIIILEI